MREPAGIPTGGRFAQSTRSEPDIALAREIPAAVDLAAALARYGINRIPDDHNGVPFTDHWSSKFAALTDEPPSQSEAIRGQIGDLLGVGDRPIAVLAKLDDGGVVWKDLTDFPDPTAEMNGWSVSALVYRTLPEDPRVWGTDYDDYDDDYDYPRTIVELTVNDELTEALSRRADRKEWEDARRLADEIVAGTKKPWDICPVNPTTNALCNVELDLAKVPVEPAKEHRGTLGVRRYEHMTPNHLAIVDRSLEFLRDGGKVPEFRQDSFYALSPNLRVAGHWHEGIAEARIAQPGQQAWQDGAFTPEVRAALSQSGAIGAWSRSIARGAEDQERLDKQIVEMQAARDDVAREVADRQERASHMTRAQALRRVQTWPGDPDDCPAPVES